VFVIIGIVLIVTGCIQHNLPLIIGGLIIAALGGVCILIWRDDSNFFDLL
jgi:hypothetical protein